MASEINRPRAVYSRKYGIRNISPYYSDDLAQQLWLANLDGHNQEVLVLLQRGAPPNSDHYTRQHHGVTPLHRACHYNHHRSAELLIKYGAIVAATTVNNFNKLYKKL